ncbi:PQQ-binding-like beta-propeller repeat protein [Massilia sp. LXY-6]|uniref:YncE family protein n=1 Tax=Massilia sp. LXY-6 TaxID=3379823 RepID=UPI003EE199EB
MNILLFTAMCAGIGLAPTVNAADSSYRVVARQVLSGPVRWDYLAVDSAKHHVFLTRGDHVDVFDAATKSIIGTIGNTAGVHGVAIAGELNRGYTSNGAADSVTVFDLTTLMQIATVPVGGKPDSIVYDPASKRVFVANAKDKTLSVIDSVTNRMIKSIALTGTPETAVVNAKGQLFVALEDKNAIAMVDTATMTVVRQYDIRESCEEPAGLAIDAATDHLFAGCHNAKMTVVDGRTGKVLATPGIGKGNDATAYDPVRKRVFASNGEGTLTVIDGAAPFGVLQNLPTMARGRTMALDTVSHQLFIVSAELAPESTIPAKGRPALKPDTFTLLTVTSE